MKVELQDAGKKLFSELEVQVSEQLQLEVSRTRDNTFAFDLTQVILDFLREEQSCAEKMLCSKRRNHPSFREAERTWARLYARMRHYTDSDTQLRCCAALLVQQMVPELLDPFYVAVYNEGREKPQKICVQEMVDASARA